MKLNFGKRVVLFFHWLLSLLFVAAVVAWDYIAPYYATLTANINEQYIRYGLIGLLAIYLILSLITVCLVFKRGSGRSERGFIMVDSSETGKVRISVGAIEQMVKQAAGTVDGIADMRISISSLDDAIAINVNVSIVSGSHVPTVTMNLQRAIRQFVELNCGVAVRSVAINVQTVVNPSDPSKKGRKFDAKAAPVPVAMPVQEQPVPEPAPVQPEPVAEPEYPVQQESYAPVTEEPVYQEEAPVYEAAPVAENACADVEAPVSDAEEEKI